jgi:hypothetical protein
MGKRLEPIQANPEYPANGTKGKAFLQGFFYDGLCPCGHRVAVVSYKLPATAFALVVLFSIMGVAVLFYICAVTTWAK